MGTARKNVKAAAAAGSVAQTQASQGITNLLYQLLETEMGGVQVYRTALRCVLNEDLREEFEGYLEETERHVAVARALVQTAGLDPDAELPARLIVRHNAQGLVNLMLEALAAGTPADAQLTAVECVLHAETKDHANWELVGLLAKKLSGPLADALTAAHDEIEEEEDHHYYHTKGWARELWVEALGLPAVLPPPEEERDVDNAVDAARAKDERDREVPRA
jgi:rubrerythrin